MKFISKFRPQVNANRNDNDNDNLNRNDNDNLNRNNNQNVTNITIGPGVLKGQTVAPQAGPIGPPAPTGAGPVSLIGS